MTTSPASSNKKTGDNDDSVSELSQPQSKAGATGGSSVATDPQHVKCARREAMRVIAKTFMFKNHEHLHPADWVCGQSPNSFCQFVLAKAGKLH